MADEVLEGAFRFDCGSSCGCRSVFAWTTRGAFGVNLFGTYMYEQCKNRISWKISRLMQRAQMQYLCSDSSSPSVSAMGCMLCVLCMLWGNAKLNASKAGNCGVNRTPHPVLSLKLSRPSGGHLDDGCVCCCGSLCGMSRSSWRLQCVSKGVKVGTFGSTVTACPSSERAARHAACVRRPL